MSTKNTVTPNTKSANVKAGAGITTGSNISELKALKAKIQQQNEKKFSDRPAFLPWLKVEAGKTVKIRILPLRFNNNMPFITVKEHRNLYPDANFRAVVCPRSVGAGECPICEYIDEHYREARENDDKGAISAIRPLFGKPRAYAVVYNRNTKQVEKIGMSTTLLGQILNELDSEEDFGDPTDLYEGRDGKLSAVKGANGFNNYSYAHSELKTRLAESDKEIEAIMNSVEEHKDEILRLKTPMSYDEIKALLSAVGTEDDSIPTIDEHDEVTDDDVTALLQKVKGRK